MMWQHVARPRAQGVGEDKGRRQQGQRSEHLGLLGVISSTRNRQLTDHHWSICLCVRMLLQSQGLLFSEAFWFQLYQSLLSFLASCGKGRAKIVISKGVPKTMMQGTAQQKVAQMTYILLQGFCKWTTRCFCLGICRIWQVTNNHHTKR